MSHETCRRAYPVRHAGPGLALALALVILAGAAHAAPFDDKPKILLHVMPVTTKNQCASWGDLSDCTQANVQGQLVTESGHPAYFVYLLVATGSYRDAGLGGDGQGIAGLQCGIAYDGCADSGVDVFSWHLCATLEFPSTGWPAAGGGNLITWDSTTRCQKGEVAIAGYFYCAAYTPDTFRVTPRPVDNRTKVATCAAEEIGLSDYDIGLARFGSSGGCNPCSYACNLTALGSMAALDAPAAPVVTASCGAIRLDFPSLGGCGTWKLYRDGAFQADASGTATGYLDSAPPAGEHCYGLAQFKDAQLGPLSPQACATAAGPMQVDGFSPAHGAPGDTVEIGGTGFGSPVQDMSGVQFQGTMSAAVPATLVSWSDTRIRCIVPEAATTGAVTVTNPCGQVTFGFTPVLVSNLLAAESDAGVVLTWDAADDGSAVGFHVYREAAGAARVRVTDAPLAVAAHNRLVDGALPGPGRYTWAVEALQRSGGAVTLGRISIDYAGASGPPGIAAIRPNPARGSAVISYRLNATARVSMAVFDVQGRRVTTLIDGPVDAGRHDMTWDGRTADGALAAPGMYVVRLEGAGTTTSAKVILAR